MKTVTRYFYHYARIERVKVCKKGLTFNKCDKRSKIFFKKTFKKTFKMSKQIVIDT